jgi:hypothetical protein
MAIFHKPSIIPSEHKLEIKLDHDHCKVSYIPQLIATYVWHFFFISVIFYLETTDFETYLSLSLIYYFISSLAVIKMETVREKKLVIFYTHRDKETKAVSIAKSFYPRTPNQDLVVLLEVVVTPSPFVGMPDTDTELVEVLKTYSEFKIKCAIAEVNLETPSYAVVPNRYRGQMLDDPNLT